MTKLNRKGAIELSASFIVVIIISLVVVVGGLSLFFRLTNDLKDYNENVNVEIQNNIKSMMLSNNYKVAVYPRDLVMKNGDSELIGIGITNLNTAQKTFKITLSSVKYYSKPDVPGASPTPSDLTLYYAMTTNTVTIKPQDQAVKGMQLKMASSKKGQYVYTINITIGSSPYGVVQVYVDN